ncbi:hypothetical protein RHGRI_016946 [Rhododendron griersonianum]|uniref:Uncharacterized protein n=1 Tax=Rhododendron griersonianum TaxID=479676 RepID=A0AAV6JW60_9ERIC|nr:hypothetical protein RHGRI_016946 [Rhododendron griersonianum]
MCPSRDPPPGANLPIPLPPLTLYPLEGNASIKHHSSSSTTSKFAPNGDFPTSISNESYLRKNSTTSSLDTSTTKSFPAHCLFPAVGLSVSGPLLHSTCLSSPSPSSPTNRPGTNSSDLSKIFGSLVANGWNPNSISPSLTSNAASWLSITMSRFARPNCSGTGGSIRSDSYTTDFISSIFSIDPIVTSPPLDRTTDLISCANSVCNFTPALPIHFIMLGKNIFMPPNELKHVANNKL